MFILHIDLPVKADSREELEQTFTNRFQPAIAPQEGFQGAQLMRSVEDDNTYCLTIAFDQQASQQNWITTDIHEEVWSAIQNLCTSVAVRKYNTVS